VSDELLLKIVSLLEEIRDHLKEGQTDVWIQNTPLSIEGEVTAYEPR
jgi:hypothetical protein